MGGWMLGITALGALGAVSRNVISSNVSLKFGTELRGDLFRKTQCLSFEGADKFDGASLVTRLTNDVTQVQNFINGMMRIFVKAPLLCIGSLIMASRLNPRLSMILLIVVPIIGVLIYLNMRFGYPLFRKIQNMLDKVNGVMREYLSGVRVVKAFNRFNHEMDRFEGVNKELGTSSITAMRVMAIFSPAITLTVNMGIVAVLWFGGFQVNNGSIHVGKIIAFINYMTQILNSLMMISFVFTMFVRARASAERIGEVLEQKDNMVISPTPQKPEKYMGRVDFENVCFSYTGASGEPVIKNMSFTCMPGETIGIIGSTGSGKSTLVNLIPRFYDAVSGRVVVDGVDVREMDPKELRESISVVPQKTILFTGTIMDNIKWGKDDAAMDEIEGAARDAQAHDFICSFPEGYNTMLGQGGVNLSGGQKQRISIARALVKRPKILILDDCTSAVDTTTEARIRRALKNYSGGITCFIIAQRITSVMGADKIMVIDNGRICGMGRHEELMEECEIYRDIYHSQLGKGVEVYGK
jgi:ATP-binding cassette subfamily B protein